jgi:HPr kinase/phosphorylase
MVLGKAVAGDPSDRTSVHGVLVSVFGSGVLIMGRSGIGKSACALELLDRGHTLIGR